MSPTNPMGPSEQSDEMSAHSHETGRDGMKKADMSGESPDETLVREALQDHPWPKASSRLMARWKAAPAEAQSGVAQSDIGPDSASRTLRLEHPRRQFAWFETAGAIAIVAAVAVVIMRGTGIGIAPADAPDALDGNATATAEANPAIGPGPLDDPTAVGEGGGTDDAGTAELSVPIPPEGTRLYGSVAELLDDPPASGETVWIDAYHGEFHDGTWHDSDLESVDTDWPCRGISQSPLVDAPLLMTESVLITTQSHSGHSGIDDSQLAAVEIDKSGEVNQNPNLPRYGRLVVHLDDSLLSE